MVDLLDLVERVVFGSGSPFRAAQTPTDPNPDPTEDLEPILDRLRNSGLISNTEKEKASRGEAVEIGSDKGRQVETALRSGEIPMVTRQEFMSVGLTKCGSDPQTFSRLSDLWNRQKDDIKGMTRSELRDALNCP